MNLGPHATFILAAYGAAALALLSLMLWVWFDYRAQRRALDALEAQGIRRRSARVAETAR
ncbi:MAG TPA: heme exporter protein CcmD [Xanthobacteraceae bacterium]|nr:heme exporter protein CcmD [Xanthobacteraceae bacterium]